MVKAEIGDALGVAGLGQGNLLGGIAVRQQTVAADDHRRVGSVGQVQGTGEFVAIGVEVDRMLVIQVSVSPIEFVEFIGFLVSLSCLGQFADQINIQGNVILKNRLSEPGAGSFLPPGGQIFIQQA